MASHRGLAGFFATAPVIIAGPILVGTPKDRPLTDQRCGGGGGPAEVGQQVTSFGGGQRDECSAGRRFGRSGRIREVSVDRDANEEGIRQQNEGDMAIPTPVAAHFILIEAQVFGDLQVLFDVPAGANGLHHGGQGRLRRGPDQIIGQFMRVLQAAAKDEPMATVQAAPMHQRQPGPIKEALAFGALALTEPLPIAGMERLVRDAGHISQ